MFCLLQILGGRLLFLRGGGLGRLLAGLGLSGGGLIDFFGEGAGLFCGGGCLGGVCWCLRLRWLLILLSGLLGEFCGFLGILTSVEEVLDGLFHALPGRWILSEGGGIPLGEFPGLGLELLSGFHDLLFCLGEFLLLLRGIRLRLLGSDGILSRREFARHFRNFAGFGGCLLGFLLAGLGGFACQSGLFLRECLELGDGLGLLLFVRILTVFLVELFDGLLEIVLRLLGELGPLRAVVPERNLAYLFRGWIDKVGGNAGEVRRLTGVGGFLHALGQLAEDFRCLAGMPGGFLDLAESFRLNLRGGAQKVRLVFDALPRLHEFLLGVLDGLADFLRLSGHRLFHERLCIAPDADFQFPAPSRLRSLAVGRQIVRRNEGHDQFRDVREVQLGEVDEGIALPFRGICATGRQWIDRQLAFRFPLRQQLQRDCLDPEILAHRVFERELFGRAQFEFAFERGIDGDGRGAVRFGAERSVLAQTGDPVAVAELEVPIRIRTGSENRFPCGHRQTIFLRDLY